MKKIYLILVAGPQWNTEENELASHQQRKMERLIEKLLPYRTSSQILRSSTDRGHYVCSSEISASLCIHEHAETERFGWSYKTEDRHAHIEKYYLKQILADIESHELVVYVGYNTLTRDVPEYFDPKKFYHSYSCLQALPSSCSRICRQIVLHKRISQYW